MENTKAAILVLAIAAALIVAASGAYAMGMQTTRTNSYQGTPYGGMMGGSPGYTGGMMGGYGTMGSGCGSYAMHQYMSQYWNSTTTVP